MNRPLRQAAIVVAILALIAAARIAAAQPPQPIKYSHKVHVTVNKIDCRFCHSSATKSASAGIPSV